MGTSAPVDPDDALVSAALDLLDRVTPNLRAVAAPRLAALHASLQRGLRVAVVGRVSAGKSTLVNALLGRRVAPTAAGECTRVITLYRYGSPDRATLVLRDGTTRPLPMGTGIPEHLGVPADAVARIEVDLQSAPLRQYSLIDTPGLGGMDRPGDVAVRGAVLGSHGSGETADAIVFLFRDVEKLDEVDFVDDYRRALGDTPATPATAIGVLSHADLFGSGPWGERDPVEAAGDLARRMARDHAGRLTDVIPVAGLLAEAARTGRLSEADARGLARLWDLEPLRLQLGTRRPLRDPAAAEAVARIMETAGPYVLCHGRDVAARAGASGLRDWMDDRSGIARLEALVAARFGRRARPLKVAAAVTELDRLAGTHAVDEEGRRRVRNCLEEFRLDPVAHRMNELLVLAGLAAERDGGGSLHQLLAQVVDSAEPWQQLGSPEPLPAPELRALARRRAAEATALATLARTPTRAAAARVLSRSYLLIGDRT
jgi:hypothetical protein